METKPALKSKTINFNALMLGITAMLSIFGVDLSKETYLAIMAAIPVLNIILRFVTKGAITLTGSSGNGDASGRARVALLAVMAAAGMLIASVWFTGCGHQSAARQLSAQTSDAGVIALGTFADAQDAYIAAQELYLPYQADIKETDPQLDAQIIGYMRRANEILETWELLGTVPDGDKERFRDYLRRITIEAAKAAEGR